MRTGFALFMLFTVSLWGSQFSKAEPPSSSAVVNKKDRSKKIATTHISPARTAWLTGLRQEVETWRKDWRLPGAVVFVTDHKRFLFGAPSGVRDVGRKATMTLDTTFPIASNSKTFTAAAIGLLVERGKLRWDDRVVQHFPGFALSDATWTRRITIRDLLVHRSGLPAHVLDRLLLRLLMKGKRCTRKLLYNFAKTVKPAYRIREREAYSNLGYVVLGTIIERVSGMSLAKFLKKEFFQPLGMKNTVASKAAFDKLQNKIAPHDLDPEGKLRAIKLIDFGECNTGSGQLFSSARDLGIWLRLFLNGGRHRDKQILKPRTIAMLTRPHMLKHPGRVLSKYAGTVFAAQAMGWEIVQYKGLNVVRMGGSGPGYQSALFLMLRQKKAIVVLQPMGSNGFYVTTAMTLLDRITERSPTPWTQIFRKFFPLPPNDKTAPLPTNKLNDYVGSYSFRGYPRIILREGKKLYIRGKLSIGMGPPLYGKARLFGLAKARQPDTMFIRTGKAVFTFHRNNQGKVVGFTEVTNLGKFKFVRAQKRSQSKQKQN